MFSHLLELATLIDPLLLKAAHKVVVAAIALAGELKGIWDDFAEMLE